MATVEIRACQASIAARTRLKGTPSSGSGVFEFFGIAMAGIGRPGNGGGRLRIAEDPHGLDAMVRPGVFLRRLQVAIDAVIGQACGHEQNGIAGNLLLASGIGAGSRHG